MVAESNEFQPDEFEYTDEKKFTQHDVVELFTSVGWHSADYPSRLYKALLDSSFVVTAWDGIRLIGLVRALDDGELNAYIKYVLVDPEYQGRGIAGKLITMAKEHYKDYLYLDVMPDEASNASFYVQNGFTLLNDGAALQIWNQNADLMR